MENNKRQWWGYLHSSGTYHTKPYYGALDTDEARESPFCKIVVGPFYASDRDDALKIVKERTDEKENES